MINRKLFFCTLLPALSVILTGCFTTKAITPIKVSHPQRQPVIFVSKQNNTQYINHRQKKSNHAKKSITQTITKNHSLLLVDSIKSDSQQGAFNPYRKKKKMGNQPYTLRLANYRPKPNNEALRRLLVSRAIRQIGIKYRYGGNDRLGFDCSGLIQHVYKKNGIAVPRTAAKQRKNSQFIGSSKLQPGDLIFFKTGKKTDHVGIFIGGEAFIHASSGSNTVKIDSLNKPYWKKHFIKFGTYLST